MIYEIAIILGLRRFDNSLPRRFYVDPIKQKPNHCGIVIGMELKVGNAPTRFLYERKLSLRTHQLLILSKSSFSILYRLARDTLPLPLLRPVKVVV